MEKIWTKPHVVNDFQSYGLEHLMWVLLTVVLVVMLYTYKDTLKNRNLRRFEIIFAIVMFTPRLFMYIWYGYYNQGLAAILPLYLCRITIICTTLGFLLNTKKFYHITFFWGMAGSILALAVPDTAGYGYPHIIYLSFFIGHVMMCISVFYIVFVKEYLPTIKDFRKMILVNVLYVFVASIGNALVNGNYNYLESPPPGFILPQWFAGSIPYKLSILLILVFVTILEFMPLYLKKYRKNGEYVLIKSVDRYF